MTQQVEAKLTPQEARRPDRDGTPVDAEECIVAIESDSDIVVARQRGRAIGHEIGFGPGDLAMIATAISELARNVVTYAERGEVAVGRVSEGSRQGILVVCRDQGPGIRDIPQAMRDGVSTSGGLGLGLPGVKRLMDEFEIESAPGRGTRVTIRKWMR